MPILAADRAAVGGPGNVNDGAAGFFGLTRVHTVHLEVAPDQWDAMEARRLEGAGPAAPGGPGGGARMMDFSAAFEEGRAARPGLAAAMGLDFPYVKAAVTIDGTRVADVGLRYKGNGTYMFSQSSDKRPMKVEFNRFEKDRRFLGLKALNLHNNVMDPTFIHESLAYEVSREFGVPGSRTAFARVTITIPGRVEWFSLGVYTLVEQVNESFVRNWFGTAEGLLFKPATQQSLRYRGDDWKPYEKGLNTQTPGAVADRAQVIAFLKLLEQGTDAEFASRVGNYVDLDDIARFLALNVGLVNLDSVLTLGQNYYLYLEPRSGKLHGWLWDLDNCWGSFPMMGTPESRLAFSIGRPWTGENRFIERLLKVEGVRQRYRAELARLVDGPMAMARLRPKIDAMTAVLRPLLEAESKEVLARFEQGVFGGEMRSAAKPPQAPGPGSGPGFGPGPFGMMNLPLVEFIPRRIQSVRDQLAGRSEGEAIDFGGPPGGGRGPDVPGGPGGPGGPRRPERPGPGGPPRMEAMAAMPFMAGGDQDHDGVLSLEEFRGVGMKWFEAADTGGKRAVDGEQLSKGIDAAMGPPPGPGGPMGMPGAAPQRLRPSAPVGPRMFGGPGPFLAPVLMMAGDVDHDGKLGDSEAKNLFEAWAKEWDTDHDGKLTPEEIAGGMARVQPGPRAAGPGAPGGAGPARDR